MGCVGSTHHVDRPGGRYATGGLRLPTDEQMRQYAIEKFEKKYINFTNEDLTDIQSFHLTDDNIRHGWLCIYNQKDLNAALKHDHAQRTGIIGVSKTRGTFVTTRMYGRIRKDNDGYLEIYFGEAFYLENPEQFTSCGFIKHNRIRKKDSYGCDIIYDTYLFKRGEPTATKFAGKK